MRITRVTSQLLKQFIHHPHYGVAQQLSALASELVRVRFAPSPTGNLHLGGLRTALYNYLFAKKLNGKFILRIEDTDQKRVKMGSFENLQNVLHWIGLHPDEGPGIGGPYGPYIQSERVKRYVQEAEELVKAGLAYRCFCSETRLELLRKEAIQNRQNPGYDNKCRHLTDSEIEENIKKGCPYTIRFKIEEGPLAFNDLVYGTHTLNISEYEGDFIILKSDKFPTYHFACVVDDHYMKISHVLRGVEWLSSTPKHVMLHKAFNWELPAFGHLPLLLNSDRTKLSKRQESIGVEFLKNQGYEPLAILNFLVGTCCGSDIPTGCNVFDLQDLCAKFDLSEMGTNSIILDLQKLDAYNHNHIVKQLSSKTLASSLVEDFKILLQSKLQSRYTENSENLSNFYIEKVLRLYQDRVCTLNDLMKPDMLHLWTFPEAKDVISNFNVLKISELDAVLTLKNVIKRLSELPKEDFTQTKLAPILKEFSKQQTLKYVVFMRLMRIVLTGQQSGPGVAEILDLFGQDQSVNKVKTSLRYFENIKVHQEHSL